MNANIITPRARAGFYGVGAFLACTAVVAVFALVVLVLADVAEKRAQAVPPVNSWSNAKLLADLGEAQQVAPCQDYLGEQAAGLTARLWVNEGSSRVVVVCTPTGQ